MIAEQKNLARIYIVDDEASIRTALGRLMRSAGMDFAAFSSGQELLDALPDNPKGCVVLDIRMPGLTGQDVMVQLRRRAPALPVIALSAQDNDSTRHQARLDGAVAFFRKPVDDQALLDAIDWVLTKQPATIHQ